MFLVGWLDASFFWSMQGNGRDIKKDSLNVLIRVGGGHIMPCNVKARKKWVGRNNMMRVKEWTMKGIKGKE